MIGADVDEDVTGAVDVVADDGVVAVEHKSGSGTRRGGALWSLRPLWTFGTLRADCTVSALRAYRTWLALRTLRTRYTLRTGYTLRT